MSKLAILPNMHFWRCRYVGLWIRLQVLGSTVADDYYDWPVITDRVMIARMREEATEGLGP